MTGTVIPEVEVKHLLSVVLQNFQQKYKRTIDPETVEYNFITPRVESRVGFEVKAIAEDQHLRIRLYINRFSLLTQSFPFRLEQVQDGSPGYGDEVYVAVAELARSTFPVLSRTVVPVLGDYGNPFAFELEDGSGYIDLEDGSGQLEVEH